MLKRKLKKRCIFNQINYIQEILNKRISIPKKPLIPYNIGDVVKIPIILECYESIFENYQKMEKSTTFGAPIKLYLFPPDVKILCPKISFRDKTNLSGWIIYT